MKPLACPHAHGEYSDEYRHCTDCGREWVSLGGAWFEVEGWVRVSTELLEQGRVRLPASGER